MQSGVEQSGGDMATGQEQSIMGEIQPGKKQYGGYVARRGAVGIDSARRGAICENVASN